VIGDRLESVRNLSAFLALYYDFTDHFTFSFEGRYQGDRVGLTNLVPNGFTGKNTYKKFVPRVTLDYKYSDDGHIYVLYSIGNNPGGFNQSNFIGLPGSGTTAADRFIPEETLYNYEAGAKGLWFDGRLSTDLAVYHMDWKNQAQTISFLQPGSTTATFAIVSGAGTSKVDGFGLSASAAVTEELTVNTNISYNRAVYKRFCSTALFALTGVASAGRIGCQIINGNKTETVPPWINSITATYEAPLSGDWTWNMVGSFQYQSGMYESDMNYAKNEPQNLIHLSAGVKQGEFSFDIYCTNCTQEETPYRFVRLHDARHGPNVNSALSVTATPRRPRQWGVKTAYRF
jgi:iron complex outermembrane receptor protein